MGPVWLGVRAELRLRWRALVLRCLVGGVALAMALLWRKSTNYVYYLVIVICLGRYGQVGAGGATVAPGAGIIQSGPLSGASRPAPPRRWPLAENWLFAAEGWCACSQGQGRSGGR